MNDVACYSADLLVLFDVLSCCPAPMAENYSTGVLFFSLTLDF